MSNTYNIPNREFYIVEFPGLVKSHEKAIQMLGSMNSIQKSYETNTLSLNFRPNVPQSRPIQGSGKHSIAFLFKVTVKRRKQAVSSTRDVDDEVEQQTLQKLQAASIALAQKYAKNPSTKLAQLSDPVIPQPKVTHSIVSESTIQCLGRVNKITRFIALSDFQTLPPQANPTNHVSRLLSEAFSSDPNPFSPVSLSSLLPKRLCTRPYPHPYYFRDNPFKPTQQPAQHMLTKIQTIEEFAAQSKDIHYGRVLTQQPRQSFYDPPMHLSSSEPGQLPTQLTPYSHLFTAIKQSFEIRPIWMFPVLSKAISGALAPNEQFPPYKTLQDLIRQCTFYYQDGPWIHCWVKKGYNPKLDPSSRILQSFHLRLGMQERVLEPTTSSMTQRSEKSEKLSVRQTLLEQICDVYETNFQAIAQYSPVPETCSFRTGWYSQETFALLREKAMNALENHLFQQSMPSFTDILIAGHTLRLTENIDLNLPQQNLQEEEIVAADTSSFKVIYFLPPSNSIIKLICTYRTSSIFSNNQDKLFINPYVTNFRDYSSSSLYSKIVACSIQPISSSNQSSFFGAFGKQLPVAFLLALATPNQILTYTFSNGNLLPQGILNLTRTKPNVLPFVSWKRKSESSDEALLAITFEASFGMFTPVLKPTACSVTLPTVSMTHEWMSSTVVAVLCHKKTIVFVDTETSSVLTSLTPPFNELCSHQLFSLISTTFSAPFPSYSLQARPKLFANTLFLLSSDNTLYKCSQQNWKERLNTHIREKNIPNLLSLSAAMYNASHSTSQTDLPKQEVMDYLSAQLPNLLGPVFVEIKTHADFGQEVEVAASKDDDKDEDEEEEEDDDRPVKAPVRSFGAGIKLNAKPTHPYLIPFFAEGKPKAVDIVHSLNTLLLDFASQTDSGLYFTVISPLLQSSFKDKPAIQEQLLDDIVTSVCSSRYLNISPQNVSDILEHLKGSPSKLSSFIVSYISTQPPSSTIPEELISQYASAALSARQISTILVLSQMANSKKSSVQILRDIWKEIETGPESELCLLAPISDAVLNVYALSLLKLKPQSYTARQTPSQTFLLYLSNDANVGQIEGWLEDSSSSLLAYLITNRFGPFLSLFSKSDEETPSLFSEISQHLETLTLTFDPSVVSSGHTLSPQLCISLLKHSQTLQSQEAKSVLFSKTIPVVTSASIKLDADVFSSVLDSLLLFPSTETLPLILSLITNSLPSSMSQTDLHSLSHTLFNNKLFAPALHLALTTRNIPLVIRCFLRSNGEIIIDGRSETVFSYLTKQVTTSPSEKQTIIDILKDQTNTPPFLQQLTTLDITEAVKLTLTLFNDNEARLFQELEKDYPILLTRCLLYLLKHRQQSSETQRFSTDSILFIFDALSSKTVSIPPSLVIPDDLEAYQMLVDDPGLREHTNSLLLIAQKHNAHLCLYHLCDTRGDSKLASQELQKSLKEWMRGSTRLIEILTNFVKVNENVPTLPAASFPSELLPDIIGYTTDAWRDVLHRANVLWMFLVGICPFLTTTTIASELSAKDLTTFFSSCSAYLQDHPEHTNRRRFLMQMALVRFPYWAARRVLIDLDRFFKSPSTSPATHSLVPVPIKRECDTIPIVLSSFNSMQGLSSKIEDLYGDVVKMIVENHTISNDKHSPLQQHLLRALQHKCLSIVLPRMLGKLDTQTMIELIKFHTSKSIDDVQSIFTEFAEMLRTDNTFLHAAVAIPEKTNSELATILVNRRGKPQLISFSEGEEGDEMVVSGTAVSSQSLCCICNKPLFIAGKIQSPLLVYGCGHSAHIPCTRDKSSYAVNSLPCGICGEVSEQTIEEWGFKEHKSWGSLPSSSRGHLHEPETKIVLIPNESTVTVVDKRTIAVNLSKVNSLSKLSSIRLKAILTILTKEITGQEYDESTLQKHLASAKLSPSESRSALSVLRFIIVNAVRYDCSEDILIGELQQLGLPNEHCESVSKEVTKSREIIKEFLATQTFALPHLEKFEWRVDYPVVLSNTETVTEPRIRFSMAGSSSACPQQPVTFSLTSNEFVSLMIDAQNAQKTLAEITKS
ncbi:putative COMM domain containing 4 [Blattamonas nauphoetae]|uniref:COMM domain containing 4 n=1 Tax=Blattamonas nauphoetae TaxID=2049346 RepID=A0ABQ9XJK4_9EUKA|nr:putative COMM domain containing 4 [Blattamonas nauphoetae]